MTRAVSLAAVLALLVACTSRPAPAPARTPLYDNVGTVNHVVTTSSPEAQRYFDQGLAFTYGFNHAEAMRAFRQAAAIDPSCAMCYWGVVFALDPNRDCSGQSPRGECGAALRGGRGPSRTG